MDCIYVYIKKYIPETSEGNNKYGRCIKPNRIKKKKDRKKERKYPTVNRCYKLEKKQRPGAHPEPLSSTFCPASLSPVTSEGPFLASLPGSSHTPSLGVAILCLALKQHLTWPLVGRGHACTSLEMGILWGEGRTASPTTHPGPADHCIPPECKRSLGHFTQYSASRYPWVRGGR